MTIIEKGDPRLEPYGYLLSLPTSAPPIENEELRYWPTLAPLELKDGWVEVGLCEVNRRPARLSKMERHVLTSESAAPRNGELLVPIAPRPTGRTPRDGWGAPRARAGAGLSRHPGAWHRGGRPDRERVSFWVIFKRFTAREDLEIAPLTEAMEIITPSPTLPARGEGDSARRAR